jgi:hypothetical protein
MISLTIIRKLLNASILLWHFQKDKTDEKPKSQEVFPVSFHPRSKCHRI